MIITRFAQSCILIETAGKRILVDPGTINYEESLLKTHWKDIDAILVTHFHGDHCNDVAINAMMKDPKTKLYSSAEVADKHPDINVDIKEAGESIKVGDIKIEVVEAHHGYIPWLKGGKLPKENVGYIIDDGTTIIYITSDTICFENDFKCDVLVAPITDCGVTMGAFEVALYAQELSAKLTIPVHYHNPKFEVDLDKAKAIFDKEGIKYKFMDVKESIEL
ncbi:MAG: MBL fold metallo-hydrolase [archaeon]